MPQIRGTIRGQPRGGAPVPAVALGPPTQPPQGLVLNALN